MTTQPPLEGAIQRFREKFPVEHYYCEDPWYSCPLAEGGSANDTIDQTKCNCYAKEKQKKIEAFISDELKAERTRLLREFEEVIKSEQLRTIDISKDVHETNKLNTFDIGVNCGLSMALANIRSKIKPINQEMKKMEGSCYCHCHMGENDLFDKEMFIRCVHCIPKLPVTGKGEV